MHWPPSTCLRMKITWIYEREVYTCSSNYRETKRRGLRLTWTWHKLQKLELLKFARRRYISIFETRKMKQTKNSPYINLSVRYRRLTTTLPKTRNIINCRNSYNKCDWKPCTLLARAATPLKYANARKVFSSQCFKVMAKFSRNFFRD